MSDKDLITIDRSELKLVRTAIAVLLIVASASGQLFKYLGGHSNVYGFVPGFYLAT
jgi:hypothetical protein